MRKVSNREKAHGGRWVRREVASRLLMSGLRRGQAGGRAAVTLAARWWGPPHLAADCAWVIAVLGAEQLGLGEPKVEATNCPWVTGVASHQALHV